jgi:hypothetical protein
MTVGHADTNYNKDQAVTRLINAATANIERWTRRLFLRGTITEFFDGSRYRYSVPLKGHPIVSITNVWDDPNFNYNTALQTSVYKFSPKTGWLKLFKGGRFSNAVQNIKVTYLGGYALYPVQAGQNDQIIVSDDGTNWLVVTIPEPDYGQTYTAEELATAMTTAIEATTGFGDEITITYSSTTRKFTIASDGGTFQIMADTSNAAEGWTDRALDFATMIGLTTGGNSSTDRTGEVSYTMDSPSGEIPEDLKWATVEYVAFLYEQTGGEGGGSDRFGVSGTGGDRTNMQYFARRPPDYINDVIRDYSMGRL